METRQIIAAVCIVGGVLALAALFLPWAVDPQHNTSTIGLDLFEGTLQRTWHASIPIFSAVLGLLVAIVGVAMSRTDSRKKTVLSLAVVVLGIAIIVLGYLVKDIVLGDMIAYFVDGPATKAGSLGYVHGFGQYVSMLGGALAIVGGVVSAMKGRV